MRPISSQVVFITALAITAFAAAIVTSTIATTTATTTAAATTIAVTIATIAITVTIAAVAIAAVIGQGGNKCHPRAIEVKSYGKSDHCLGNEAGRRKKPDGSRYGSFTHNALPRSNAL